jgi:SPP1 family predicted phage head-tail adaptor
MSNAGVAYLIRRAPEARGVLDEVTETYRKVYVTEKDVSMTEKYQAGASGLAPEMRLKLSQRFEWKGEDLILYKGTRWKILRPYSDEKADGAELTLERENGNAAAPEPEAEPEDETGGGEPEDETGGGEPDV